MYFNGQLLWWESAANERRKLLYIYGILCGSENATDKVQRMSSFSSIHNLKYGLIIIFS